MQFIFLARWVFWVPVIVYWSKSIKPLTISMNNSNKDAKDLKGTYYARFTSCNIGLWWPQKVSEKFQLKRFCVRPFNCK